MIKSIIGSKYIHVSGNSSGPYISPGSSGAGMLRWNSNMNQMEVNDGNTWIALNTSVSSIELSPEVVEILEWGKKKLAEEQRIEELCKKYPGLQKAKDNFEMFKKLVENEQPEN
jgi:hypothetical protein